MTPPPKKRLLRFSLRTMLVVVTVLCVLLGWLAWKVGEAKQQREAVAWILENSDHTVIFYDYQRMRNGLYDHLSTTPPGPTWLHDVLGVNFFCSPDLVMIHNESRKTLDLTPLSKLSELRHLTVHVYDVRDVLSLVALNELETLVLNMSVGSVEIGKLREALPNCEIRLIVHSRD